jgi:diguanylate cyclase (GGDEF)-like protein/PAS domain S-box-containing protein
LNNDFTPSQNKEDLTKEQPSSELRQFNFFMQATMGNVYEWNIDKNKIYISENLSHLIGYDQQWVTPEVFRESIHPDYLISHYNNTLNHFKGQTKRVKMEFQLCDRDGNYHWVEETGVGLRNETKNVFLYIATIYDITDRKATEEQMLETNARLLAITKNASSPIALKDNQGHYVMVNDVFCKNQGITEAEAIGKTAYDVFTSDVADMIASQDLATMRGRRAMQFEITFKVTDGRLRTYISERFPTFSANGQLTGVGEINTDITQRKKLDAKLRASEHKMRLLASTDPLTGAKNRRSFFLSGNQELARSKRYQRPLCILMVDIDHFKTVNDEHGHAVGNTVLKKMVSVCHKALREQDILGRLGGEEFGIILPEIPINAAYTIAERLRKRLMKLETKTKGTVINITVSIGVSQCKNDTLTLEDALNQADQALYKAKQGGRNRVCI